MKKNILFIFFIVFPLFCFSQEIKSITLSEKDTQKATEVVKIWIDELFKGESVDKLFQVSDLPFVRDGVKILNTDDELRKMYESIFSSKGKRKIPKYKILFIEHKTEIVDKYLPLNVIKTVVIIGEGEDEESIIIGIAVKGEKYKIVGFKD